MKKNRILSKQHILKFLRYAGYDLPSLESKMRKLTSEINVLRIQKERFEQYYYATALKIILFW